MKRDTQNRIKIYQERIPYIKEKLSAAGMGLLVAFIVAASATFAWITLSRAPEVSEITTNLSANGSLEIALSKEDGSANDRDAKERIRQAKKNVDEIKQSKYALGKNPENLTTKQQERLALIQAEDPQLMRGHAMKEKLRLIFKLTDPTLAEEELDGWLGWAQRCRIPAFVELGRKIRRHREHILDTVRYGLSNARIEATNNKIKLLIRIAYGFRNIDAMIGLIMLFCSSIEIPWPGRTAQKPVK